MNNYNIIFLEGVRKIGKSSQCVILKKQFDPKREFKQLNLDSFYSPAELDNKINEMRDWCQENPKGLLLVNGSLAYSIVYKDLENHKYGSSYEEYESPIRNLYNLMREFRIFNILLRSDDYNYLNSRYTEHDEVCNPVRVRMFYDGFEFFQNSQINSNFKWNRVTIQPYDTILQINNKIMKLLE